MIVFSLSNRLQTAADPTTIKLELPAADDAIRQAEEELGGPMITVEGTTSEEYRKYVDHLPTEISIGELGKITAAMEKMTEEQRSAYIRQTLEWCSISGEEHVFWSEEYLGRQTADRDAPQIDWR